MKARTRIQIVPYTGKGTMRYIFKIAIPITIPGNTKGNIAIWSRIQRHLMEARTINQAAKKVIMMATVADVMLTVRLLKTEPTMLLAAKPRAMTALGQKAEKRTR